MLNAWHQPVPPFVVKQGQRLDITLWLQGDELPERVFLRAEPDNEEWLLVMKAQRHEGMRRYQASLTLNEGEPTRRYCFKLLWADRQQWFGPQGWSPTPPGQLAQFALDEPDHGPEWVADQLFYQIFPDRFASSGGEHGIQSGSYRHHAAGAEVIRRDWQHPLEDRHAASTFYGGDLDGISAKLPYLQQLGVTALYLNPIFTAPSVHKYDTEDYYQVDPHFGGNAALQRLRVSTHKVGMKLVLDGVFNHTGDSHPWFDRHRQGENGACHHPDSPYRGWFNFYPDGRALDWKGNASLPKLNFAEPQVAEAIYRGEGSVVRHWLRPPYSIDGWRLDVVHMLGENGGATGNLHHLAGIYQAVKQGEPSGLRLGRALRRRAPLVARRRGGCGDELHGVRAAGAGIFGGAGRGLSPGAAGRRRVRAVDGRLPHRAAARPPADPVQPVGQPRYRAFSHAVAGERGAHANGGGVVAELDWRALPLLRR